MKYVQMGNSGLKVSRLSLGCMSYGDGGAHAQWTLSEEDSMPFFQRAFELGINFVDTADGYSNGESERVVGRALKEYARRDEVVLATKFSAAQGPSPNQRGASRKNIMSAVDASLRRLGTDYIDLYQQHSWDPTTPLEETLRALDDLVRAGKVLHIGASNYKAWQFAKALHLQKMNGWTRFISMQVQYNMIYREEQREMIPLCQDNGVGVMAWSALARGFLAGNRTADGQGQTARAKGDANARSLYFEPQDFAMQERLAEVAAARGVPPMHIAMAWILAQPGITAPVFGATKLHQIDDAVAAEGLELTADELKVLDEMYSAKPVAAWPPVARR